MQKNREMCDSYLWKGREVKCFFAVCLNYEWNLYLWESLTHPWAEGYYPHDSHNSL